jgi:hypothetical protein
LLIRIGFRPIVDRGRPKASLRALLIRIGFRLQECSGKSLFSGIVCETILERDSLLQQSKARGILEVWHRY